MLDEGNSMSQEKVVKTLEDAWDDFKKYFDEKCKRYSSGMKREEAEKEHWICWSEFDMLTQLARFFYNRLKRNGLDNVEMHVNERLSPKNFEKYEFDNNLEEVNKELKRIAQPDLIIAFENSRGPFILCAEAKCLRYSVEQFSRGKRTVIGDLEKDKDTLLTLKNHNVCSYLAYVLLDDHYFIHKEEIAKQIEKKLDEYNQKHNIMKLYHTSKAKIPAYNG
jgi:hypothetical protein